MTLHTPVYYEYDRINLPDFYALSNLKYFFYAAHKTDERLLLQVELGGANDMRAFLLLKKTADKKNWDEYIPLPDGSGEKILKFFDKR